MGVPYFPIKSSPVPVANPLWYFVFPDLRDSIKDWLGILVATLDLPIIQENGFTPNLNPGTLSCIIEEINPEYFFAWSAGITASPGDSIAGTTSPAPFGPGTLMVPEAYILGATRPGPVIVGGTPKAL